MAHGAFVEFEQTPLVCKMYNLPGLTYLVSKLYQQTIQFMPLGDTRPSAAESQGHWSEVAVVNVVLHHLGSGVCALSVQSNASFYRFVSHYLPS